MKKNFFIVVFISWLLLSLVVRIYALDWAPQTVGFDEASLGFNAYNLLLTGKDEYATRFPLSLRSFNDFKPALYSYLAIPFIKVFGLNQLSVRLPSAVLGTLSLVFIYLIIKKITNFNSWPILTSVIFISFLPWRIHFSRVAFESNISMAFFSGAMWCLLNFPKNLYYKIGLILFSVASIYSYHSARVAIPLIIFLYFLNPLQISRLNFKKHLFRLLANIWVLILIFILYLPLFMEQSASLILTRLNQTNFYSHFYPFVPKELIMFNSPWLNIIANPIYYITAILSGHIVSYISPRNLSLTLYQGVIKSAQSTADSGMLGFLGGVFFILGLYVFLRNKYFFKFRNISAYWFIGSVLPAVITWEWFYPLRALNLFALIDIIVGLGFVYLFKSILKIENIIGKIILIIFFILVSTLFCFYNVINEYGYGSWLTRGEFQPTGFKESAVLINQLKERYPVFYLDCDQGQSYEILWFYLSYPPQNIQALAGLRNKPGIEGPATFNFDKFVYKKFDWPKDKNMNNFAFFTNSEIKEDEIKNVPKSKLYKITNSSGDWIASIVTKD